MNRSKIVALITEVAKQTDAFDRLEMALTDLSRVNVSQQLLECGIIPEQFEHSSSEEKLWAKYCDILLAKSLDYLEIESSVLRTRGDSADVFGKTQEYSLVADAKAFRLSRTAKNQKDFKINALDDWRRENTFVCLVAPLYQYPATSSQIYYQAYTRNVTLLSYVHLKFLLDHPPHTSLKLLWKVTKGTPSKEAKLYWQRIESVILELTGKSPEDLKGYLAVERQKTEQIGREGIVYWESVIKNYHTLSQKEAVQRLIQAEKLEQKIKTIENMILGTH